MKSKRGRTATNFRGMNMKNYAFISVALMLTGCVSMGTNYDPNAVAQLQSGMSKEDVIARLGKPNSISQFPDGRVQLGWVHSTGSMFGANARAVSLIFDANGRLLQTVSQNQIEMK